MVGFAVSHSPGVIVAVALLASTVFAAGNSVEQADSGPDLTLFRRGQAVVPGEPVVMISERSVNEIVAYLAEADGLRVEEQQPVRLVSHTRPGVVADSVVLRVSLGIQVLPQCLWRNPQIADCGRAEVIAPQAAMRLTPGETIEVRFISR